MNYCSSCHRDLNGVLSCPGCGATGDSTPRAQNAPADTRARQGLGRGQNFLPTGAHRSAGAAAPAGTATGRSQAKARARAHAAPDSVILGGGASAEPGPDRGRDSAAETPDIRRARHSHRRRSLARRVTATGGFAGIAVIGSLALSNLSTPSGNSAAPAGSVAITSTLTQQGQVTTANSGTSSTTTTASFNGNSSAASAPTATTATASATSQNSSGTSHYTPRHAAQQSTSSATASAKGVQTAPTATPSTTQPSSTPTSAPTSATPSSVPSSPSPSATQSTGICILVLCL